MENNSPLDGYMILILTQNGGDGPIPNKIKFEEWEGKDLRLVG
ncbi:hypothetical protein [Desulfuromonas sp. AOP6]|nr:hypothetical protein [Desulfuromonas sp. AOP6]